MTQPENKQQESLEGLKNKVTMNGVRETPNVLRWQIADGRYWGLYPRICTGKSRQSFVEERVRWWAWPTTAIQLGRLFPEEEWHGCWKKPSIKQSACLVKKQNSSACWGRGSFGLGPLVKDEGIGLNWGIREERGYFWAWRSEEKVPLLGKLKIGWISRGRWWMAEGRGMDSFGEDRVKIECGNLKERQEISS